MNYVYFIVYLFRDSNNVLKYARVETTIDKQINDIDDIITIEEGLKKQENNDKLIVIDFKLLRKE